MISLIGKSPSGGAWASPIDLASRTKSQYREVESRGKRSDSTSESIPSVVDLDGMLRTDLLFESALRLIKQKPEMVLYQPR
jgi:hypothetical protein